MSDQEVKKEEQQEDPKATVLEFLFGLPGAPSSKQIDQWKAEFGDVFISGFSEKEIYIFRPIRRSEHRQMQISVAQSGQTESPIDPLQQEELVCNMCVLYPAAPLNLESKAGTASTLFEQIMQNSHFVSPAAASMLVFKL